MKKLLSLGVALLTGVATLTSCDFSGLLNNLQNMAKDAIPTVQDAKIVEDKTAGTITLSYTLTGGFEGGDMKSEMVWSFVTVDNLPESLAAIKALLSGVTEPICISAILKETYATADDAKEAMMEHSDSRAKLVKKTITTDMTEDYTPSLDNPENVWPWSEILEEAEGKKAKIEKTNSIGDLFNY